MKQVPIIRLRQLPCETLLNASFIFPMFLNSVWFWPEPHAGKQIALTTHFDFSCLQNHNWRSFVVYNPEGILLVLMHNKRCIDINGVSCYISFWKDINIPWTYNCRRLSSKSCWWVGGKAMLKHEICSHTPNRNWLVFGCMPLLKNKIGLFQASLHSSYIVMYVYSEGNGHLKK